MKTYNKLFQLACMAVLMGAATGCADEALVEQPGTDKPVVPNNQLITVKASVPDGTSRIAYNESESKLTMTWEATDAFTVLRKSHYDTPTVFVIDEDTEGERYASFTGAPNEVWEDGDMLVAVYPKDYGIDTEMPSSYYPLYDLSEQDGKLDNAKQFMYAATTYEVGKASEFKFQNLTSILKLTLNFPEGVHALQEIVVRDAHGEYYSSRGLNLTVGGLYPADYNKTEYRITGNLTVVDGALTVYVYMFAANDAYPAIIATDADGNQYANSFKGRDIVESKMYRASAEMIPIVPFNGGDGSKENPFQIDNLAQWNSLAALTAVNMNVTEELKYSACHYVMTSDIELSADDVVYPVGGHTHYMFYDRQFSGTFDGQGHQFTGVLNLRATNHESIGLFSNVTYGRILNLHLNATAGDIYDPSIAFGGIVGMMAQGEVWGCSSSMSVSLTNAKYVGGIVGSNITKRSGLGSTIDGCWFTGDLASAHSDSYVGGITGAVTGDVATRTCYATGSVTGHTVGGIHGAMYEATITLGCWNAMTLNGSGRNGAIVGYVAEAAEGEEQLREGMFIYHCYHSADIPVYGDISPTYTDFCDIVGCGNLNNGDRPSFDQIEAMNAQLKDNSYDGFYDYTPVYKFDNEGRPVLLTTSSGNTNGSNFDDGGEF